MEMDEDEVYSSLAEVNDETIIRLENGDRSLIWLSMDGVVVVDKGVIRRNGVLDCSSLWQWEIAMGVPSMSMTVDLNPKRKRKKGFIRKLE